MKLERTYYRTIFASTLLYQIICILYNIENTYYKNNLNLEIIHFLTISSSFIFILLSFNNKLFNKFKVLFMIITSYSLSIQQYFYLNSINPIDNFNLIPTLIIGFLLTPNITSLVSLYLIVNIISLLKLNSDFYQLKLNILMFTSIISIFKIYSIKQIFLIKNLNKRKSQVKKIMHLGEFSKGLSHHLNNKAMRISLILNIGKEKKIDNSNLLEREVNHLTILSKNLNIFTEENKSTNETISIKELITYIKDSSKIKISNYVDKSHLNKKIKIKKNDLLIILQELEKNAIEASQNEKHPFKIIVLTFENNSLKIQVQNNGSLIDNSKSELIFEPFYTTKDVSTNLGLGLTIAFKIAHSYNINIKYNNHQNNYNIFSFELPVIKK